MAKRAEIDEQLDDIVSELQAEMDDALDFVESELEDDRARSQRYYNGDSDLPVDANRSKYVATKVRDTIRAVRPSLMRTFMSCAYPVEFVPGSPQQGQIAAVQTQWAAQFFEDMGGYQIVYSAFHDAMLNKLGVVKYWYERGTKQIYRKYTGLSEQQVQMVTAHPNVQVIAGKAVRLDTPQGPVQTFDLEVVGMKPVGEIKMAWVPLNEFMINREATCKADARLIAHRRSLPRGDLAAMGFDPELLEDLDDDEPETS